MSASVLLVPAHHGYATPLKGATPSAVPGSYVVLRRAGLIMLVDSVRYKRTNAPVARRGTATGIFDVVDASVPPLEPGMVRIRTRTSELLVKVGHDRPTIVPHGGSWDEDAPITDLTVTVGDSRVVLAPGERAARPSALLLETIGLLAVIGRREAVAAAVFAALLGEHRVLIAAQPGKKSAELTGSDIPFAPDAFLLWNGPERTWAIEIVSPDAGLPTWGQQGGRRSVSPVEVLRLLDRIDAAWPVPAGTGVHRLDGDAWHRPTTRPSGDEPVRSHALVADGQARLLRLATPRRFDEADSVLRRLTAPVEEDQDTPAAAVTAPAVQPEAVQADRHGVTEAVAATHSYTERYFGQGDDAQAVARLSALPRTVPKATSPLTPEAVTDLARTNQASFERHRKNLGREQLAWLCMELALDAPETTALQMGDALTFYLSASNARQREPQAWLAQVIVRAARQWVKHRRIRWDHYREVPEPEARSAPFQLLAASTPWLWWYVPDSASPGPVALTEVQLVETVALVRPQFTFRFRANKESAAFTAPFAARFRRRFTFPAADELDDDTLESLADALRQYFGYPWRAAAALQAVALPDSYRSAVRTLLQTEPPSSDLGQVLALRTRTPDAERVMVVNLSERHPLVFSVARHIDVRLEQRAIEQEGAAEYVSPPLDMEDDSSLTIGGEALDLGVDAVEMAPPAEEQLFTVSPDLFRGRERELDRLRVQLHAQGRRVGSLIIGNRRAGKTTLAWRLTEEQGVRGSMFIDLAATRWNDIGDWNRRIVRELLDLARLDLGVSPEIDGDADLVEAIATLDRSLTGRGPVVLILDELDVLLTVEHGTDARRLAGRLGSASFRNLVVLGTVQRFHGGTAEFKNWQVVPCPSDLTWKDAVTYFMPALADTSAGPRVVQPDRAALSPQVFRREVYDKLGLRPYFWGQLRSRMDALVRFDSTRSRLIGLEDARAACLGILDADAHLAAPLDVAPGLTADEAQRRDLFTADERAILLLLADMPVAKEGISRVAAEREGGRSATDSLIERAYLTPFSNGEQLKAAVPIYQLYLHARRGQLRDLVERERAAVEKPLA